MPLVVLFSGSVKLSGALLNGESHHEMILTSEARSLQVSGEFHNGRGNGTLKT